MKYEDREYMYGNGTWRWSDQMRVYIDQYCSQEDIPMLGDKYDFSRRGQVIDFIKVVNNNKQLKDKLKQQIIKSPSRNKLLVFKFSGKG